MTEEDLQGFKYKIGAAERLTGIPAMTLRMWERRYDVVKPERTSGNGRLYSKAQLARLSMLRRLVDAGHAISTVANLTDAELGERIAALDEFRPRRAGRISVLGVGPALALGMRASDVSLDAGTAAAAVELRATFENDRAALEGFQGSVDALVVERSIVTPETRAGLSELAAHCAASVVVVVYEFASSEQLEALHRAGFHTVSAPVQMESLSGILQAFVGVVPERKPGAEEMPGAWMRQSPPHRRFSTADLFHWAGRSTSTVKCECPEHLVSLINRLVAFEEYSRDCESRNADDAAIHGMLHHTTANARRALEDALAQLIDHEFPGELD